MSKHIKANKTNVKKHIQINWSALITGIWVLCMLIIQPILIEDYSNVLELKYGFFLVSTGIMIGAIILYELISKNNFKDYFAKPLNLMDYSFMLFSGILIISTLQAYPYIYQAFFGNEGRYCGFIFWFLCCLAYFAVSRNFIFDKRYLIAFSIASMIVAVWAVLDYFYIDVKGIKQGLAEDATIFFSTIGNVNTLTGFLALPLGITGTMFVMGKCRLSERIFYFIGFIIVVCGMIVSISDNAYISFAILFIMLPFFAWKFRVGIRRYIILLASFLSVAELVIYWNHHCYVVGTAGSLLSVIESIPIMGVLIAVLWILAIILSFIDFTKKVDDNAPANKTFWWAWLALMACGLILLIYLIIAANSENLQFPEMFKIIEDKFVFNDYWGTKRGYIWRASLENYAQYPIHHLLFGTGPDTAAIYMWNWKYFEMVNTTGLLFNNPHNAWIQMLVTIGPIGLIAYLGTFISPIIYVVKNKTKTTMPYLLAIGMAGCCHLMQSAVNIMTPMDYPTVFGLLAVAGAILRRRDEA